MKFMIQLLLVSFLITAAQTVLADDASGTTTAAAPAASSSSWSTLMQKKYNLTDAQVKALADSKLPESEQVKVAQLAKSGGKTVDEVLKMRTEDKMGWGKIAKTLGVHPGELGRAVSDLRKEQNAERKKEKQTKHEIEDAHHMDMHNMEMHHNMNEGHGHGKPDHPGHGKNK
jgi:hypothetical protein